MRMSRRMGLLGGASGFKLEYTGTHTVEQVGYDGVLWEQWALIGSGILRVVRGKAPLSKVWLCSGGSNGGQSSYSDGRGGLGGYARSADDVEISGDIAVTVGAGGTVALSTSGSTSFGSILTAPGVSRQVAARPGGTGGGRRYANGPTTSGVAQSADTGDGLLKVPFGDDANFDGQIHCAGGGAGGVHYRNSSGTSFAYSHGGVGGSNGSDGTLGGAGQQAQTTSKTGGAGGALGGGKGGDSGTSSSHATDTSTDATFYGSGGGGKGYYSHNGVDGVYAGVAAGYQGIVYVRVPMGAA